MRRFYKTATAEQRADSTAVVLLDGKVLKTPARQDMVLPGLALAQAIAAEWDAQGEQVRPLDMPMTRLAATAIDRVAADIPATVAEIVRYGDTDLLSYRAEAPPELATRQQDIWQPLLDWFRERYDIQLQTTTGIMAISQPVGLRERLTQICQANDPLRLAALQAATAGTGSVVIGLALLEGRLDAAAAHEAGLVDELYQAGAWGEDEEAAEKRAALRADLESVWQFIRLLDTPG